MKLTQLQFLPSFITSTTVAAAPSSPSATTWQHTGQFIYYDRRAMLSIDDVPPLRRILEGAIICNVEHHAGDCGTPPPGIRGLCHRHQPQP